jgi:hypothetical protein
MPTANSVKDVIREEPEEGGPGETYYLRDKFATSSAVP